jgi:hypothetical protein
MTHQRQLSSLITLIQLTSVVDLDNRIQHKIKQSVWSLDAAHLCFHQPFGTYMMPQSTVMPEPTTCLKIRCEGWNNKFCNLVGHAHPSIWRVIEWCQKQEATVCTIIQQDAVGNPPVKRIQQTCSAPGTFTKRMQRPHYWPEDHCRVLVWSRVVHQTKSPTLVLRRQLRLWTFTILNWKYSMFVCSSWYRYDLIYFLCYLLYDL